MEPIALEPVDSLTITSLVDNVTDMLLVDEGPAKRHAAGASGHAFIQNSVGTCLEFTAPGAAP